MRARSRRQELHVPYPWRRHIALVAIVVVIIAGGAYLVGRSYGGFFAFAFSMVGGFALALPLGSRTGTVLPDAVALAIGFGLVAGAMLPNVLRLDSSRRLHQTTPAELPNAPDAAVFTFRDGNQVPELSGSVTTHSSSTDKKGRRTDSTTVYAVAPLVGPGWTREQPVPAWSICVSSSGYSVCEQQFRMEVREGLAADHKAASPLREAIETAQKQHGLRAAAGARLVDLVLDAEQELRAQWRNIALAVLIPSGIWAAVIFIIWAVQTVLQRRHSRRL